MCLRAALPVLLLFIATANTDNIPGVEFWRLNFIMTCTRHGTWYDKSGTEIGTGETLEIKYENEKRGRYHCTYDEDNRSIDYFYVQGKVCENCFELDTVLFGFAIALDVLGTGIVMMIIYRCTKKRSSAGLSHPPKTPARPGGRGPAQSSDYEQLNTHTRSQDTYSMVNRMG